MATALLELRAEMEDGTTYDVVADQRDIAKWEVQDFGRPFRASLDECPHMLFRWLAWSALTRRSEIDLSWTDFDAKCVEAGDIPDEESELPADAGDPGQTAPSA
ncbi:hypothetical protein KBX03_07590 [Micromonospora sp. C72]|uniref:hypothetical protein n=1 Tax=Micromonospora sp. C72 TaxID=2824880 RepID=UPI001B39999A|nr:hypothetical protein [Micromonospora sp. C72]MBQ1042366.1 hypothetical protein [Micromonospora sp. C72]